ncbi:5'-nucleotidase [Merdibacter massiliensis]|uniref:5'-nucleotidase n=1 Tax=Merdibacter massiliensis TaxID=1871030 RepID=UPI00096A9832|nr:5'-nucleotidase [Merdibacter massiliensis]
MPFTLENCLVVGISSRALFDLSKENAIFEKEGLDAYRTYQIEHEDDILQPGSGFALVKALLQLNELSNSHLVEVLILSRNGAETSLRIFQSIEHYHLDITRAVLSGGESIANYLAAFGVDLFLSADEEDVQAAIDAGFAAGIIYPHKNQYPFAKIQEIRIAFDGDAVLFSDESERIYQEQGLKAFIEYERANAKKPLPKGPFANLLKTLSKLQESFPPGQAPIRTALVTARNAPAQERVIRTLRAWNVRIDEAFFLGGIPKKDVLEKFGAHIFFDDQEVHASKASEVVPSARVPYKSKT